MNYIEKIKKSTCWKCLGIISAFATLMFTSEVCTAQSVYENQYYTEAEVFESIPVYGKSSLECITCENVLIGYKLGVRFIQKNRSGDLPIIFDITSKKPVAPGTWVKVGLRLDLVFPIKTY